MFTTVIDLLTLCILRLVQRMVLLVPVRVSIAIFELLVKVGVIVVPRYRSIAMRNLQLAFPEAGSSWRENTFKLSMNSFARVLVDFLRLPKLDALWFKDHVTLSGRTPDVVKGNGKVGVLYVTGHLGSFEILAHYCAVFGYPLSFIARDLPLKSVSAWVRAGREKGGNKMIAREGATKEVLRQLEDGTNVGILFDQNVTRKHAVFVPWFGRLAATARTVGLAAMRTRCPVVVVSIKSDPASDSYKIVTEEVDLKEIYDNESLDLDDRILEVTRRVSDIFVQMIRNNPSEWFWMHRRWKTAPEGMPEDFYS